jgi:hypothetical protein
MCIGRAFYGTHADFQDNDVGSRRGILSLANPYLIVYLGGLELQPEALRTPIKETNMRQMIGAMLVLMLVVAGCASTQEAKSVKNSGFLGSTQDAGYGM